MQSLSEESPVRVLIADDNADAADVLHDLFETLGCVVQVAYNGKEAVEAADQFKPQLVILDIDMPEMDGCETASRLRLQPWSASATFVACSAASAANMGARVGKSVFHYLVSKPARFAWFEALVDAIRRRRNKQAT